MEITAVSNNHTKHINKLYRHNEEFVLVEKHVVHKVTSHVVRS